MKKASYKNHNSKQHLFNNAFQNVCRFRDIEVKSFAVLDPKISYYVHVTYDLNFDMNRLRLSRTLLLTLISNYWQVKWHDQKTFDPFKPLLKRSYSFVWYHNKSLVILNINCFTRFHYFLIVFEIFKKEIFRCRLCNSFTGPFGKKWFLTTSIQWCFSECLLFSRYTTSK